MSLAVHAVYVDVVVLVLEILLHLTWLVLDILIACKASV